MSNDEHSDYAVWRRVVDEMLAAGEKIADAVAWANMVLRSCRPRDGWSAAEEEPAPESARRPNQGAADEEAHEAPERRRQDDSRAS